MKAFPRPRSSAGGAYNKGQSGMDLRDYFAAKAMQGVISDHDSRVSLKEYAKANGHSFAKEVSIQSYDLADAMMKQRSK